MNNGFCKPVQEEEVEKVAVNFVIKYMEKSSNLLAIQSEIDIRQMDDIRNSTTGDILAHVVHVLPKGFLIISTDTDISPVIVYSLNHDWITDDAGSCSLYQILESDLKLRMRCIEHMPDDMRIKNNQLWQNYLNRTPGVWYSYDFQQWPGQGTTITGGWLETTWTQRAPYNDFCPLNPDDSFRCPAGCGAIAIAQIVNYHCCFGNKRFSNTDGYTISDPFIHIDEDCDRLDFPSFSRLNERLDTLQYKYENDLPLDDKDKAALCFACGIMTRTEYSGSQAATFSTANLEAFTEKMNYATAELRGIDSGFYDTLIENMKQGLPAELSLMKGLEGHAIVCDGYNTEGFYHVNFGWGNTSPVEITDAWYQLPEGLPGEFSIVNSAIINIRPATDNLIPLVVSDTLIRFEPVLPNRISEIAECILKNNGSTELHIEEIIVPPCFSASLNGQDFFNHLGPVNIPPEDEVNLQVFCQPDSLGKFYGKVEIHLSRDNLQRYQFIELVGFGRPETGTVVTENRVSGIWDKGASPYYIVDHISVMEGKRLYIEAGTRVLIQSPWQFNIGPDAQLIAKGIETDSVYITAMDPGKGWEGLSFITSGNDDTLAYCFVSNTNPVTQKGGAVKTDNTKLTILHSSFIDNHSEMGGAVFAKNSDLKISRSVFIGNSATYGGALYFVGSDPVIEHTDFRSNRARFGGAVLAKSSSPRFCKAEFIMNSAQLSGGAFNVTGSDVVVENCILNANDASGSGSILAGDNTRFFIKNITSVNHRLAELSDLFAFTGNTRTEVNNSIFWGSTIKGNRQTVNNGNHGFQSSYSETDTISFQFNDMDSLLSQSIINAEDNITLVRRYKNISEDPCFLDAVHKNYKLQENSPCIDAGNPCDSVGAERFPHGYCRNLGAYGGTTDAQQTLRIALTVSPDPVQLGDVIEYADKEYTIYLKNGCPECIHLRQIVLVDSMSNTKATFRLEFDIDDNIVESGEIDSFSLKFNPHLLSISGTTYIIIYTNELKPRILPVLFHFPETRYMSGTLDVEGSPYFFDENVTVRENRTLTIEPGVELLFSASHSLIVGHNAQLRAIGRIQESIRFAAADPVSGWDGINILDSGHDDTLAHCVISDVNKNYFGQSLDISSGAVYVLSSRPGITHCCFENNRAIFGSGIFVLNTPQMEITHCSFRNNYANGGSTCEFVDTLNVESDSIRMSYCTFENNRGKYNHQEVISAFYDAAVIENTCFFNANLWISPCSNIEMYEGKYLTLNNITMYERNPVSRLIELIQPQEQGSVNIRNSIFWMEGISAGSVINFSGSSPNICIDYCDIDTISGYWFNSDSSYCGFPGTGNICKNPLFMDTDNGDLTLHENSPCIDAGDPNPIFNDAEDPQHRGFALWPSMGTLCNDMGAYGGRSFNADHHPDEIPGSFALFQNYPNPFNNETWIRYQLPVPGRTELSIYNLLGQKVVSLVFSELSAGTYEVLWDGRNRHGHAISSGIYFYRLKSSEYYKTKKMIVIR